jgi:hypothetical protein
VIGAVGAIGSHGASEFGGDQDHGIRPCGPQAFLQASDQAVESLELAGKARGLPTVRIPAAGLDHGQPRAIRARQEARGHPAKCRRISPVVTAACAGGHAARLERGGPESVKLGVVRVELLHARHQVVVGLGQRRGHIGCDFDRAAQRQRHRGRKRNRVLASARQQGQKAVHPAVLHLVRGLSTGFEHVLPVEVRSIAVGRGDGVEAVCLPGSEQLAQLRQRGMQGEAAVQLQRALGIDGKRAAKAGIGRLGIRDQGVRPSAAPPG